MREKRNVNGPPGKTSVSARTAMMSVVFAAMFMLTVIAVYGVYADWENQQQESLKKVFTAANDCAAQQKTRIMSTEILLRTMASAYTNFGKSKFYNYITEVDWKNQEYIKIKFFNLDGGQMLFPGQAQPDSPEAMLRHDEQAAILRNRAYFQDTLSTRKFTVGEYAANSPILTGPALPMAMPVMSDNNQLEAVAVAALDMSADDAVFSGIYDKHGIELIFFDRWYKLLYRYPMRADAPLGKVASDHLIRAINTENDAEAFFHRDPFGRDRSYAVVKLRLANGTEPYMHVVASGTPKTFGEFISSLYLPHMTILSGAFIFSMLLAAVAGRLFFSKGLERLAVRVDAVKSGDLTGRMDMVTGCREIQILAEGMNSMLDSLEETNTQLKRLSNTDPLTGLYNRRHFYSLAIQEMKRAGRGKTPMAVAMVDLDYFKKVNDTYGHDGGDAVLRSFSALLTNNLRTGDIVARFGGEEFIIFMPETKPDGAMGVAEKILLLASDNGVPFNGKIIPYTVSIGLKTMSGADLPADVDDLFSALEEAITKADEALYLSKKDGRNRISRG